MEKFQTRLTRKKVFEEIEKQGLTLWGVIPQDEMVYRYDCDGKPTSTLPRDAASRAAFDAMVEKLF